MKVSKQFKRTRFSVATIQAAIERIDVMAKTLADEEVLKARDDPAMQQYVPAGITWEVSPIVHYTVTGKDESEWELDTLDEWIEVYEDGATKATISYDRPSVACGIQLNMFMDLLSDWMPQYTSITANAPDRNTVLRLLRPFNEDAKASEIPEPPQPDIPIKIFIGHGFAMDWMTLSNDLHHVHGYDVVAFEYGSSAGLQITDFVQSMVGASTFALLVLTPDDETADGEYRARQNVIHELGLCQGKLGFSRVLPIVQRGVEGLSNLAGTKEVRFAPGEIRGTVGEVLAALKREFPK